MTEEKALLINIATILAKDVLLDSREKKGITYPSYPFQVFSEDDDDDGLDLLVFEMQQKGKQPFNSDDKVISLSDSSEDYQDDLTRNGNTAQLRARRKDLNIHLEEYFTKSEFESNLHMSKQTFNKILRSLTPFVDRHMKNIDGVIISEKSFISLGLWKLATDEHLEEMSRRFKIPLDVCHWTVHNFCSLLSSNLRIFVKWPVIPSAGQLCQDENFPQLSGIIALRQIDVFFESQDEEASVILQIICGLDQQIMDCHVDLATSYSFDRTPFAERMRSQQKLIPSDSYLIGDASLPLRSYLMRPFGNPSNKRQRQFNELLDKKRSTMHCVLNKMVKRFHSLYALETKNIRDLKRALETICVLHNLCQFHRDNIVEDCCKSDGNRITRHFGNENDEGGRRRRTELLNSINLDI